ncbi:MAG: tetratricopeptide repeat protein [Sphingomonas sp.]|nr:MAG: tetratricopeptide repeat protein [Sphingomonas sp.]
MTEADIQRTLAAAQAAQRAGARDEAARHFRAVLAADPDQPVALNALGVQALGRGAPDDAIALFRRAIAADAQAPELWMNLARAHRARADDAAERAALEGALAIDQRHFMALVRIAELFERTGDEAAAMAKWDGVLAMSAAIDAPTPALQAMLDHAREFVARAGWSASASLAASRSP